MAAETSVEIISKKIVLELIPDQILKCSAGAKIKISSEKKVK
jgi:hypothetical protein